MLRRHNKLRAAVGRALAASLFAAVAAVSAGAQDFVVPPQPAPPPMRYVPEQLRAQLDATPKPKDRLRLSLELMEQYLARAEQHTASQRYDQAAADLGVYLALVDDSLAALRPVGRSREGKVDGSTRDLYKRLELALNKHTARIESARRATPDIYARNVLEAFRHARARRTEALDSFFVDTVVRPADDSRAAPPAEQTKRPR